MLASQLKLLPILATLVMISLGQEVLSNGWVQATVDRANGLTKVSHFKRCVSLHDVNSTGVVGKRVHGG